MFLQAEELRIMKEQTEKAAQAASNEKVVRVAFANLPAPQPLLYCCEASKQLCLGKRFDAVARSGPRSKTPRRSSPL